MKPTDLRSMEDAIFARYRSRHPSSPILGDGAADAEAYFGPNNFRVLFVLKEGNDPTGEFSAKDDIRDFARYGAKYPTWGNLARWSATARCATFAPADAKDRAWRAEQLKHSAFVNIKKIPGGSKSNDAEVEGFALAHADLIREQLSLYRPHLTLACGRRIFSVLENVFSGVRDHPIEHEADVLHGFSFFRDAELGTVIHFYHPQYTPEGGTQAFLDMLRPNLRYHFPERFLQDTQSRKVVAT